MWLKVLSFVLLFSIISTKLLAQQISLQEAIDIALKNNYLMTHVENRIITADANIIGAESSKKMKMNFNTASVRYNQKLSNEWSFPENITTQPLTVNSSIDVMGIKIPFTINVPSTQIPLPQPENIYYSGDITYSMNLSLRQAIYTFGKLEGLIYQSKKAKELANLEFKKTQQDVILNTKIAYYNFLKTKGLYNLANEGLKQSEAHLKDAKLRFELGKVAEFDVIKATINLENTKSELLSAKNALNLSRTSFNIQLGIEGDNYEPKEENLTLTTEIPNLHSLIELALQNRLELKQLKINQEIAKSQLKVAKANRLPSIGIEANYNLVGHEFPPKNKSWNISLLCDINLYDSGETKSKIINAMVNLSQLKDNEKNLKQKIELEVKSAYFKLINAKQKIEILSKNIDQAKLALNIANIRYNKGLSSAIEVLDTQFLLNKTKMNYIQAIYDYKIAEAELQHAIGKE